MWAADSLTEVYICSPETGATLESNWALRDDGGTAVCSHQVMDLVKDLGGGEKDRDILKSLRVPGFADNITY